MDEIYNKHYVAVDDLGRIVDGWSDGPRPDKDTESAFCINERGGYQFRLITDGEENPPLRNMDGIPMYKLVDGKVVKRKDNEIDADRTNIPPAPPSNADRLEAQVTYTAMKTHTLLEVD